MAKRKTLTEAYEAGLRAGIQMAKKFEEFRNSLSDEELAIILDELRALAPDKKEDK